MGKGGRDAGERKPNGTEQTRGSDCPTPAGDRAALGRACREDGQAGAFSERQNSGTGRETCRDARPTYPSAGRNAPRTPTSIGKLSPGEKRTPEVSLKSFENKATPADVALRVSLHGIQLKNRLFLFIERQQSCVLHNHSECLREDIERLEVE